VYYNVIIAGILLLPSQKSSQRDLTTSQVLISHSHRHNDIEHVCLINTPSGLKYKREKKIKQDWCIWFKFLTKRIDFFFSFFLLIFQTRVIQIGEGATINAHDSILKFVNSSSFPNRASFPHRFLFGAGTSAAQVYMLKICRPMISFCDCRSKAQLLISFCDCRLKVDLMKEEEGLVFLTV